MIPIAVIHLMYIVLASWPHPPLKTAPNFFIKILQYKKIATDNQNTHHNSNNNTHDDDENDIFIMDQWSQTPSPVLSTVK